METIKLYILKFECDYYGISYEIYQDKNADAYVKYADKWSDKYKTKWWKLNELVWKYEYFDWYLEVSLIEKDLILN